MRLKIGLRPTLNEGLPRHPQLPGKSRLSASAPRLPPDQNGQQKENEQSGAVEADDKPAWPESADENRVERDLEQRRIDPHHLAAGHPQPKADGGNQIDHRHM